jgi:hypothetical protein
VYPLTFEVCECRSCFAGHPHKYLRYRSQAFVNVT